MPETLETLSCTPPWGAPSDWAEANLTLESLTHIFFSELDHAKSLAMEIKENLESLFPMMDELSRTTCPWCPEPCCVNARIWIDFHDLLFLHLINQTLPPAQLQDNFKHDCRYFGHRGCSLPRLSRPWICTWYVCPTQMAVLRKKNQITVEYFTQTVRRIKSKRKDMEDEFIRVIS